MSLKSVLSIAVLCAFAGAEPAPFLEVPLDDPGLAEARKDWRFKPEWYRDFKAPSPLAASEAEKRPLTPADVVGPDGVVYPDFSWAGIEGGIPELPVVEKLSDWGLVDGGDLREPLEKAVASAVKKGGGAILVPEGRFLLRKPFVIQESGIVIRGSGRTKTFLEYRAALKRREIRVMKPETDGTELGLNKSYEIEGWFDCDGWKEARIVVNGIVVQKLKYWNLVTGMGRVVTYGSVLDRSGVKPGEATVKVEVDWNDGTTGVAERTVKFRRDLPEKGFAPANPAMIRIAGVGSEPGSPTVALAKDGLRGDVWIELASAYPNLAKGEYLFVEATPNPSFLDRVRSSNRMLPRRGGFRVEEVDGTRVRLNQPLRIDFPAADPSTVRRITMVRGSGIERLTLDARHPEGRIWHNGVGGQYAANCWIRDVDFKKLGRNPFAFGYSKGIQIEDCDVDDAWFKDGGGTAYVFWEGSWDCLMQRVTGRLLRHAPNFQYSASGCVIRDCEFEDSDAQFHAGYPHENLIENCRVLSKAGNGSYGFGLYVQESEYAAHGPQGPRNVLWRNRIRAEKPAVWFGGNTSGYVLAYNQLVTGAGPAFFAKAGAIDNLVIGNAIRCEKPGPWGVAYLATEDCTGWRFVGNRISGAFEHRVSGQVAAAEWKDNVFGEDEKNIELPDGPVKSLYLWQKERRMKESSK